MATTGLLKNGGWTFQGSREDIIIDERDSGWQVTETTDQHQTSGPTQFVQRHAGYWLRRRGADAALIDAPSRTSQRKLRELAQKIMAASATA